MSLIFLTLDKDWHGKEYAFFSHKRCEAFPCHDTDNGDNFNCLFCYCPLYFLDGDCGGKFTCMPDGVKNCGDCTIPHDRESYGYIISRLQDSIQANKVPK